MAVAGSLVRNDCASLAYRWFFLDSFSSKNKPIVVVTGQIVSILLCRARVSLLSFIGRLFEVVSYFQEVSVVAFHLVLTCLTSLGSWWVEVFRDCGAGFFGNLRSKCHRNGSSSSSGINSVSTFQWIFRLQVRATLKTGLNPKWRPKTGLNPKWRPKNWAEPETVT